jgi:hypothetical protein
MYGAPGKRKSGLDLILVHPFHIFLVHYCTLKEIKK